MSVGTNILVRECTAVSVIGLCEAGRYRLAWEMAQSVEPSENLLGLGMVEIQRGNLDAAKDYLSQIAFGSNGLSGRAKIHLAVAYWYGGERSEAKDLLKTAPDSFEKFLLRAIIEDRPKYALRLLDKCAAYSVRPGMAGRLHNQRALIYRKVNQLDAAIQEYEAALYFFEQEQSDCTALVFINLAGVYLDFGELDRANSQIDKAISLLQDDPPHLGKALDTKPSGARRSRRGASTYPKSNNPSPTIRTPGVVS